MAKFTIDATQERCVAVISQFSVCAKWDEIMFLIKTFSPEHANVLLDGVRGRLSRYVNNEIDSDGLTTCIVVVAIE